MHDKFKFYYKLGPIYTPTLPGAPLSAFFRCALGLLLWLIPAGIQAQVFTESAALHGIALDGVKDGGFSFADLNNDGWLDLVVNTDQDDAAHRTRMFLSSGPPAWAFTDITATHCKGCQESATADGAPERCVVFADFNQDGHIDFVRNSARRLEVFLNKGPAPSDGDIPYSFGDALQKPNFSLYTNDIHSSNPQFGIPNGMNTEGVGAFDYDNDGDLDLFIENHDWGMDIYQNVGFATATFVHVTPNSNPLGLPIAATDGDYAAVTDLNDDGLVDAIARKRDQRDLFLNTGGVFSPVLSFDEQANNLNKGSTAFHDFDNDGDFDLFWTEHDENQIWIQTGINSGVFSPTGEPWVSAGLPDPFDGLGQALDGLACGDIDHDGDIDLFLADDAGASYLFLNQWSQTGVLAFQADNLGIDVQADGEGSSFYDIDEDGDLDLYININEGNNQLWINNLQSTPEGEDYLVVEVFENRNGSGVILPNERDALGATIRLTDCDGNPRSGIKESNGGYGHGNQENRRVHFGLPEGPDDRYLIHVSYVRLGGTRTTVVVPVIPSDLGPGHRIAIRPQDGMNNCQEHPVAMDDSATGCPGETISLFPLANDSEPDGSSPDPLGLSIISGPFLGSVLLDPLTGELTYTPSSVFSGSDSLLYQYCSSGGLCDSAWVLFTYASPVGVEALLQQPFCPGFGDGAIALLPMGGTPPYTFLWGSGDTSSVLFGLVEGLYPVQIADANGCQIDTTFELTDPEELVLIISADDASGAGICDGTASVSVSGGTPPYTYLWSPGGESTASISGLCAAAYFVLVTDANGCTQEGTAIVDAPGCSLSATLDLQDPACAGEASGSATVLVAGGLPPYSYLWLPGGQTSASADSLPSGAYVLLLSDAAGCSVVLPFELEAPEPLNLIVSGTPVSAPGALDGSASVSVSGGTPPYTYLWNTGQTTPLIEGLGPGTYTVLVTDSAGCTAMEMVVIPDDSCTLTVTLLVDPITCSVAADGSITANASGGTAPYTYVWSDGQITSVASGLAAGIYTVVVTDALGCTASAMATLSEPSDILIGALTQNPGCSGSPDGFIDLMVSGGTPPYNYLWNTGASTEDLGGLEAGIYSVLVTDAAGCTATASFTLDPVSDLLLISSVVQAEACPGTSDGSISVIVTGGLPPYTYFWPDLGSVLPVQTGLAPGFYAVEVSDASGCQTDTVFYVAPAVPLDLSAVLVDPHCGDSEDGSIDLSVSGGTAPYTYFWSDGSISPDRSGLGAGVYTVVVTDANGCSSALALTLSTPSDLSVSIIGVQPDCGQMNGSISASVSGGIGPVSIVWSDGQTGSMATGLVPGFYTVTVSDGLCSVSASVALGSTSGPALSLLSSDAACDLSNGTATVSASGVGPFSYLWSDGQTAATAVSLSSGTYTVLVTDANGCVSSGSVLVEEASDLMLTTATIPPTTCAGSDGKAMVNIAGGLPPFLVQWSNGDTGPLADSLSSGWYEVVVTDAAGCQASASFVLADGFGLALSLSTTDASCGTSDGSATVIPAAGVPPYTYSWSNGASGPTVSGLHPESYFVVVTDAAGCTDLVEATIGGSEGFVAIVSADPVSCTGADGALTVSLSGGTAPFDILWSTGATTTSISGLSAGTYSVNVSDASGCSVSTSVVLSAADSLVLSISSTPPSAPGIDDGTASVSVSGGQPPYSYLWLPGGQTTASISGLSPGVYTVLVTDAAGCTGVASVSVLDVPCDLSVSLDAIPAGCSGAASGSITAVPSGGTGPYTFLWSNGQTGPTASGLLPGSYSVIVTDALGCTAIAGADILESPGLVISGSLTNPACSDDSDGAIDLTVSGGTEPYTFLWNIGAITEDVSSLTAGVYSVSVSDALGCFASASFTLSAQNVLTVSLLAVEPACGENDGQISASVSGASGSLTYLWSDGQTGPVAVGLSPGFYSVTVSDGTCSAMQGVVLGSTEGPELSLSATASGCGLADGSATVTASGGGPFTYLWSDGQLTATASGLSPGTYSVLVTDAAGCATAGSIVVPELNTISLSTSFIPPTACGLANGLGQVLVTGGLAPYSYTWSNGDTLAIADSLAVGSYTVSVVDAAGCSATAGLFVADGFGLDLSLTVLPADCGLNNGSATVSIGAGSAPYGISWSNGAGGPTAALLAPGEYTVLVTDALGCSDGLAFSVEGSDGLVATVSATDPSCDGADGVLSITLSGGVPPFDISWSTGSGEPLIDSLLPGLYILEVTDARGCGVIDTLLLELDCGGPPVAVDDTVATHQGVYLVIDVLQNDSDAAGSPGPPVIVLPPVHGTAVVLPDGTIGYTPNPDFFGIDSLHYEICNASGCSTATVIIYVGIGNNPPVALPDAAATLPSTPVYISVGENDFDPDGDPLTWTLFEAPQNGSVAIGSGTALYIPDPGFSGVDSFVYVLCDPAGLCDTALVVVTVEGPGALDPIAVDDAASTEPGVPVVIDILMNDIGGGFPLDPGSVSITSGPEQGTVLVDPLTGEVTYTPNPGFIGVDSFTYQVCNTGGFCDEALVIVTVGSGPNPPVANNDFATTPEGVPVLIPVLANDSDPDGPVGPPVILTPPSNGTVLILPDGSILYTPNPGFSGLDVFTYEICDPTGWCDDAVVFITVDPVNEPPVAVDDYTSTEPGVPVIIPILDNDSDPDGDPLTVSILSGPTAGGSVIINPDGSLTYFPGPDGITDTIVYLACDPSGLCDTAIVVITVGSTDNPPVVGNDSTSTVACILVVAEVLLNDIDPDGDPLTIAITSGPASGTAIATDDQKIVYIPEEGFIGVVFIGYEACDTNGNCTEGLLTIHVLPEYLAPAAFDDVYLVASGSPLGVYVLDNDFSPSGNPLIGPEILSGPSEGTAVLNPDGSITYVPAEGFTGTDSLQYAICDTASSCLDALRCDTAWAYFIVFDPDPDDENQPPVAVDDDVVTPEDTPVIIDILDNDFDPDGDPLTVTLLDEPENGTIVLNPDGTVTYTPNAGFEGCDSFHYSICDPGGLCDTATVTICIEPGFFIPDVITPNGDGSNDFFVITGLDAYPNNGLSVYNRWGDEVYSASPYRNDWDGTYEDRGNLPDGTYYYILNLGNGSKALAGFIAIFR